MAATLEAEGLRVTRTRTRTEPTSIEPIDEASEEDE
jgi:hypothetical protein